MPTKTKSERRRVFGEPVWITKAHAAALGDESLYTVDRKIASGVYESFKDPVTGAVRVRRENVVNPKNSEEPQPAA
jgi:hypothetical protein